MGKSNPGDSSLATNFDSLEEELELQYAPLGYALEPDFHGLVIPSGEKGSDLETDKTNVSIVFQALRDLTPAQATDERLWATLALKHLSAYAQPDGRYHQTKKRLVVTLLLTGCAKQGLLQNSRQCRIEAMVDGSNCSSNGWVGA